MRDEYCEKVNGYIANDSTQHHREGKMFDVFQDLRNHRNERGRVCNEDRECGSDRGSTVGDIPKTRTDTSNATPSALL